jgi:hypothetical protein
LNLFAFLLPLMGTFQWDVQNNLSKAYKETKGPRQFREKNKILMHCNLIVYCC